MNWYLTFVVVYLTVAALIQMVRGARRTVRAYDNFDMVGAPIEMAVIIWLILKGAGVL